MARIVRYAATMTRTAQVAAFTCQTHTRGNVSRKEVLMYRRKYKVTPLGLIVVTSVTCFVLSLLLALVL